MENIRGIQCVNYRPSKCVDVQGNPIFTKQIAFYCKRAYSPAEEVRKDRRTFRLKCTGKGCSQSVNVYKSPSSDGIRDISSLSKEGHVGDACTEAYERFWKEISWWECGLTLAEQTALAQAAGKEMRSFFWKIKQIPDGTIPDRRTLYNQLSPYVVKKRNWLLQNGIVITISAGTEEERLVFQRNVILPNPEAKIGGLHKELPRSISNIHQHSFSNFIYCDHRQNILPCTKGNAGKFREFHWEQQSQYPIFSVCSGKERLVLQPKVFLPVFEGEIGEISHHPVANDQHIAQPIGDGKYS